MTALLCMIFCFGFDIRVTWRYTSITVSFDVHFLCVLKLESKQLYYSQSGSSATKDAPFYVATSKLVTNYSTSYGPAPTSTSLSHYSCRNNYMLFIRQHELMTIVQATAYHQGYIYMYMYPLEI